MFGFNLRSPLIKFCSRSVLLFCLSWGLISCSDRLDAAAPIVEPVPVPVTTNQLSEVPPPSVIQELRQVLAQYQPQVKIVSPKPGETLSETTVSVQLEVKDYPLFKDTQWGLGPHLHLIVDNKPYQAVYTVDEPIILEDLTPGTHTLRVFASRPWHESFKNEGAYAQTTFHVFTETEDNSPNSSLPLLTYSRPKGSYGAEPIMLDFYLTNAPLHFIAQNNPDDDIVDWRIKVTINGDSFLLDTWQPIYLKGFKPGKNWIQLQFLDEQGNEVNNAFNNTVRLITYEPDGEDTLSQLIRGELSAEVARSIVDPNYSGVLTTEPTETETPEVSPPSATEPEPTQTETTETEVEDTSTVIESPESETPDVPESSAVEPEQTETETVVEEVSKDEVQAKTESNEEINPPQPDTEESPINDESVVTPSEQDADQGSETVESAENQTEAVSSSVETSLSEIVEPEPSNSLVDDVSVAPKNQWLENLAQSLKKINLKPMREMFEGIKNQLSG